MPDETPGGATELPLGQLQFDTPIPESVRNFGKVLDPAILQPGDLLLVCHKKPRWISRQIQKHQKKLYNTEHSRWHHAIVSAGGVEICEALANGVTAREFWEYMNGDYELKVRRVRNISPAKRAMIAYYSATMAGKQYGFSNLLGIIDAISTGKFWERSLYRSQGVICSQLYFESCMRIGVLLMPGVLPERVTPAHLSASALMEDVQLQWAKV